MKSGNTKFVAITNRIPRQLLLFMLLVMQLNSAFFHAQTSVCNCWDWHGNISDEDLIHTEKLKTLSISFCGWHQNDTTESTLRLSDFTVFQCNNKDVLCRYYALDECIVESANDTVSIFEVKWMPAAPDWEWTEIRIRKRVLFEENGIILQGVVPCPLDFNLSDSYITRAMKGLDKYIGNTEYDAVSKLIGTLEFLAITGNNNAHKRLLNLESYYGIETNAATAEHWADAKKVVQWVLDSNNL